MSPAFGAFPSGETLLLLFIALQQIRILRPQSIANARCHRIALLGVSFLWRVQINLLQWGESHILVEVGHPPENAPGIRDRIAGLVWRDLSVSPAFFSASDCAAAGARLTHFSCLHLAAFWGHRAQAIPTYTCHQKGRRHTAQPLSNSPHLTHFPPFGQDFMASRG